MVKGQARISLHGHRDALVKLLKEYVTLSDMALVLRGVGVQVSISSLYRYMLSDLSEEYKEYLWHTGRGLLKSRQGQIQSRGQGASRLKATVSREPADGKIFNQKDFNKFMFNNR
ncbi:hypothetical protein CXF92_00310 [Pseudomonas sp. Choline-3u-10]|nr:hypothetical protein CXF92_00310 [Pseudomonas sp. Choline-3u-10]